MSVDGSLYATARELLRDLVQLPSQSGSGTTAFVSYLTSAAERVGGTATTIATHRADSPCVLLSFRPPSDSALIRRPGLLFAGHLDTVPASADWTTDPYTLEELPEGLRGLGVSDMKGFFASVLAVCSYDIKRLTCPVYILATSDEEIGCLGAKSMNYDPLRRLDIAGIVAGEPTSGKVVFKHPGKANFRLTCTARGGHASKVRTVVNPLHVVAAYIVQAHKSFNVSTHHGSFSAGALTSGTAPNVIPDRAEAVFEVRYATDDAWASIRASLETIRADVYEQSRELNLHESDLTLTQITHTPALAPLGEEHLFANLYRLTQWEAGTPEHVVDFGTEAGIFQAALSIPTIVWGPGDIDQAHTPDETLDSVLFEQFVQRLASHLLVIPDVDVETS